MAQSIHIFAVLSENRDKANYLKMETKQAHITIKAKSKILVFTIVFLLTSFTIKNVSSTFDTIFLTFITELC